MQKCSYPVIFILSANFEYQRFACNIISCYVHLRIAVSFWYSYVELTVKRQIFHYLLFMHPICAISSTELGCNNPPTQSALALVVHYERLKSAHVSLPRIYHSITLILDGLWLFIFLWFVWMLAIFSYH